MSRSALDGRLELRRTVAFATLGCRLNQVDTQEMQASLEAHGFRTVALGEGADVVVVNSCTVTGRAEFSDRQMIRRAARTNPAARIVVTGCWAQTDPAAVAALRRHLDHYVNVRPLFAADFYPLTEWNDDPTKWLAFQFHDPATGAGIVQAFRGPNASQREHTLKLQGLDTNQQYHLTDWDQPTENMERSGLALSTSGIEVQAGANAAVAIVLHYKASP